MINETERLKNRVTELEIKMQRLRDALIEIGAVGYAYKGCAEYLSKAVDEQLAKIEVKANKILEENQIYS